ncbi:probable histone-lysine N-methyltransferase PRDM7 [Lytechinus variegatus]|uniref:probable histone-lysine N-methyltransferase PRDM7 n=1 Tax=Lytechinus variegatus TaxID=7654 RepID=UPI001BB216F7|nr:probable histone-lysine N-methyltransferase PRDM7 [Lytechinus variegatus]
MDDYSDIQVCFTAKEWAKISDYERICLKNIKENYEMIKEVGFQVRQPKFLRRQQGTKKEIKEEINREEEDRKPKGMQGSPGGSTNRPVLMHHLQGIKKEIKEEIDIKDEEMESVGLVHHQQGIKIEIKEETDIKDEEITSSGW